MSNLEPLTENMPTTILESFSTGFSSTSVASSASSSAHISGSTTEACDPPGFALEIPYQTYAAIADTALNQCQSSLSQKYLADWETGTVLRSEGDVVASSAVYLNNPVQLALEATAAKIYTHRSEVTQGSRTRADKIYYRYKTSFAVLDYKTPGVLNRSEFQYGIIRSYDNFAAARHQGRTNRYFDNLELRFARTLLKQSVHYSEAYRTPFIALFDWNTLILLVLHKREDSRGGDYCYITIVDDRKRFRKALLGFLLIAGGGGDTGSKVRVIKPTKEEDFQRRWDTDERNPSLYEKKDRPSRSGAKKPEGLYDQSFQSESEHNDSLQRGRQKARDNYYPPTANARSKHEPMTRSPSMSNNGARLRETSRSRHGHRDSSRSQRRNASENRGGGRSQPTTYAAPLPISSQYYMDTNKGTAYVAMPELVDRTYTSRLDPRTPALNGRYKPTHAPSYGSSS